MGHQPMVTTELSPIPPVWRPTLSAGAVIGLTALGIGLALADPGLAGSTRPHSVPLGRPAGTDRAPTTTTDPHKEGIT